MHLGCEAGPLDEVGTGLAHWQAAVCPHGRLEVAAKDPEKSVVIMMTSQEFQAVSKPYFICHVFAVGLFSVHPPLHRKWKYWKQTACSANISEPKVSQKLFTDLHNHRKLEPQPPRTRDLSQRRLGVQLHIPEPSGCSSQCLQASKSVFKTAKIYYNGFIR